MISCYGRESDEELECIHLQFRLNVLQVDIHKILLNQAKKQVNMRVKGMKLSNSNLNFFRAKNQN